MKRGRKRGTHRSSTSTKGWSRSAPDAGPERRALAARCGIDRAFLKPNRKRPGQSGYPVMAAKTRICAPDCKGLQAAYRRARQLGHKKIAAKAVRRGKAASCTWARKH
jgi:hypothetical protein